MPNREHITDGQIHQRMMQAFAKDDKLADIIQTAKDQEFQLNTRGVADARVRVAAAFALLQTKEARRKFQAITPEDFTGEL